MSGRSATFVLLGIVIAVVAAGAAMRAPRLADPLIDRLVSLEPRPTYRQRGFERMLAAHYAEVDRLVPPGATLVVGDSLLMAIPGVLVPTGVNLSIGGETMARLAARLGGIASRQRAAAVVLGGGTNDLLEGRDTPAILEAWRQALAMVPETARVVCVGVPDGPAGRLDRPRVATLNAGIDEHCRARGGHMVHIALGRGEFGDGAFDADGVHLTLSTRFLLARAIARALGDGPPR